MSDMEIALTIISVLGTVSSIMFAYLAFKKNNAKDDKKEGKNEGILISDVGYIKSSTERIEKRLDKLETFNTDIMTRVVVLENEMKNIKRSPRVKETRINEWNNC